MEQELDELLEDDPQFIGLHELILHFDIHPTFIATAIEQFGIYSWDRFDRLVKADNDTQERALDALADYLVWERRQWDSWVEPEDEYFASLGPQSLFLPPMKDHLNSFGWFEGELPDMRAIAKTKIGHASKPPRKSAETRRADTMLVLIAALANAAKIDLSARGAAARLRETTELIGASVHEDTIGALLKLMREAVERRSK